MGSTFFGLNIASRALSANQTALDVVGHNVANASTPGYSRQSAALTTTQPFAGVSYQVGTGVDVNAITRSRDSFMDSQFRNENQGLGYWQTREDILSKIEGIFTETADTGINTLTNKFWQSTVELEKNAGDPSVRSAFRQAGVNLATSYNQAYQQLLQTQIDLNSTLQIKVSGINNLARQISDLNAQVAKVEMSGENANDLRDRRDLLLDELSKNVNITVTENQYGQASVSISGQTIISDTAYFELKTASEKGPNDQELLQVVFGGNGVKVDVISGEIKGVVDSRDQVIQGYMDQLNTLAKNFINQMNLQHKAGYDSNGNLGGNLFYPDPATMATGFVNYARDMAVDPSIMNGTAGLSLIAASATIDGTDGNGGNALAISNVLKSKKVVELGTTTVSEYYAAMIGQLGVDAQGAKRMSDNQEILVHNIDNWRESVAGVNMDEEMANMIKFQRGYQASAKVLSTMNDLLETLINGTVR